MRVGILTFHWASNYGAVLQAFALQRFLSDQGHQVEIINYRPVRVILAQTIGWILGRRVYPWRREMAIRRFRRENLKLTRRVYRCNRELRDSGPDFELYICGSDQVWNEWFVRNAERRPTLTYYLDFVPEGGRRVAYATSFGADQLSGSINDLVKCELRAFSHIGVRERTGREIVQRMGLSAALVADPTLLLEPSEYDCLIPGRPEHRTRAVFAYILHEGQATAESVVRCVGSLLSVDLMGQAAKQQALTVPEWLMGVRDSDLVVTNSYHCVVFSIVFHTPFIALPVETGNMNDRLLTLLTTVGLLDRIASSAACEAVRDLIQKPVDWAQVDGAVELLRRDSSEFLRTALG